MKDEKRRIKFGFISIPKNTVLKHESFLTGKVTAISPGLKFVFGYVESQDLSIKGKQISDVSINNIDNEQLFFDISITYRIAGGTSYNSFECKDYFKFIEACVMEEKRNEKSDWLCKYNNKISYHGESFFRHHLKEFYRKGLRKWWKNNHPVLQYDKYEKTIVNDEDFLNSDLKSSLTETFFNQKTDKIDDISTGNTIYKQIFYSLKKRMAKKGFELADLNIDNIRIKRNKYIAEIVDNDENISKLDLHLKKIDKIKKDNELVDDNIIVDFVPLETKEENVVEDTKDDNFVVAYKPLEIKTENNVDEIEDGNFVLAYNPLEIKEENIKEEIEDGNFAVEYKPLEVVEDKIVDEITDDNFVVSYKPLHNLENTIIEEPKEETVVEVAEDIIIEESEEEEISEEIVEDTVVEEPEKETIEEIAEDKIIEESEEEEISEEIVEDIVIEEPAEEEIVEEIVEDIVIEEPAEEETIEEIAEDKIIEESEEEEIIEEIEEDTIVEEPVEEIIEEIEEDTIVEEPVEEIIEEIEEDTIVEEPVEDIFVEESEVGKEEVIDEIADDISEAINDDVGVEEFDLAYIELVEDYFEDPMNDILFNDLDTEYEFVKKTPQVLMLGNSVIEINVIPQSNFKLSIPSFVNNGFCNNKIINEKVKVLTK